MPEKKTKGKGKGPLRTAKATVKSQDGGLYEWQKKAIEILEGENAILSAPTGSGKTRVCFAWAHIDDPEQNIVFTAPIKALSNERYGQLKRAGYDVGIDTGDFKEHTGARIICCTQETYTNRYAQIPDQKVIIDEFHYAADNPDRARAYIDGIIQTEESSKIMVLSATFGNMEEIRTYLEGLRRQTFRTFQTRDRASTLIWDRERKKDEQIRNALVFAFSAKGVIYQSRKIAKARYQLSKKSTKKKKEYREREEEVRRGARRYGVDNIFHNLDMEVLRTGVGVYYSTMLPKEKLLIESLYRNRVLDTVVGTDALALGVNLPAENIVFVQMEKYYSGTLTPTEFDQMCGRGGRPGYFDTAHISLGVYDQKIESNGVGAKDQEAIYRGLVYSRISPMHILVEPDYKKILKAMAEHGDEKKKPGDPEPEEVLSLAREEVESAAAISMLEKPEDYRRYNAQGILNDINRELETSIRGLIDYRYGTVSQDKWKRMRKSILTTAAQAYFPEFDPPANLAAAVSLLELENASWSGEVSDQDFYNFTYAIYSLSDHRSDLQALLQLKRYIRRLPDYYFHMLPEDIYERMDAAIDEIDGTVLHPDDYMEDETGE